MTSRTVLIDRINSLSESLSSTAYDIRSLCDSLIYKTNKLKNTITTETIIPETESSIGRIERQSLILDQLSFELQKIIDDSQISIPHINTVEKSHNELRKNIDTLVTKLENSESKGGFSSFNIDSFQGSVKSDNTVVETINELSAISNKLNEVVINLKISVLLSEKSILTDFEPFVQKSQHTRDEILGIKDSSEKTYSKISNIADRINKIEKDVILIATEIEPHQKKSKELSNEIANILVSARENGKIINELSDQYKELSARFPEARSELQNMEKSFRKFASEITSITALSKNNLEKTDAIIESAENSRKEIEALLSGATNIALGKAFTDRRDQLRSELKKAQASFTSSIVWLALSTIPLVATIIFITINQLNINFEENIIRIIAFTVFILPFIWRARVSHKTYHNIFRLLEDYEFKLSLALSVEGFKRQSPQFSEEIVAATYGHLLFNPADNISTHNDNAEDTNPTFSLHSAILDRLTRDRPTSSS